MTSLSDEWNGFRCARDSVRKMRKAFDVDRTKEQFVLFEENKVISEIGTRRDKINFVETKIKFSRESNSHKTNVKDESRDKSPQIAKPPSGVTVLENGTKEAVITTSSIEAVTPSVHRTTNHGVMQLECEADEIADDEAPNDYFTGDVQCAWCDDGGQLLMCDGPCMRGFHMEKGCNPLNIQEDLRTAIVNSKHPFECPNCWAKIHRCFECSKEVKLDPADDKPLIAKCDVIDCGHFYCTTCQQQISKETERRLGLRIKTETSFICPLHFCKDCGSKEDHAKDILFPCRRCPTACHERCMSRKLREDPTRVWRVLLNEDGTLAPGSQVSSNFFYCGKHKTQNMLQGPEQARSLFSQSLWKKWRTAYALKFRSLKSSIPFLPDKRRSSVPSEGIRNLEDFAVASMVLGDQNGTNRGTENQFLVDFQKQKSQRKKKVLSEDDVNSAISAIIDKDAQKMEKARDQVRELIEDAMKDISIDHVENQLAKTFPYTPQHTVKLTDERLDYFVRTVESADYDPRLLKEKIPSSLMKQMDKALKTMKVACAPFIFPKYTSFGRHFTKTIVLEHCANHLIAYLKPNDMIVDFSCGSNEFIGIILDFCRQNNLDIRVKAFDLFTPFRMDGFVRKSWLDVKQDELDDGHKLIIGLNPPFGVNAALANIFVNHAAQMNPKLMLLICPPQTVVPQKYRIIHENSTLCANKAFYIPGLRANQGNDITPPFRVLKRIS